MRAILASDWLLLYADDPSLGGRPGAVREHDAASPGAPGAGSLSS